MNSTQDGMVSKVGGSSPAIRVDDGDGPKTERVVTKRKADTDCENREFELTLQDRLLAPQKDFKRDNAR